MDTLFELQRQHTAGAYIGIKCFMTKTEAINKLAEIASEHPERPYNGEDSWQDSNNKHNVTRYRIVCKTL